MKEAHSKTALLLAKVNRQKPYVDFTDEFKNAFRPEPELVFSYERDCEVCGSLINEIPTNFTDNEGIVHKGSRLHHITKEERITDA